jgi:FKBP-type peptidyl-prolyl cis-trans isomerase FkpA
MNLRTLVVVSLFVMAACSKPASDSEDQAADAAPAAVTGTADQVAQERLIQLAPGLGARILKEGEGVAAEAGQIAVVHYTGWLYDEMAENRRGNKFDSSVDRDQYFSFMLGAGRVIRGWDAGVVGMKVGETRELTIAPDMAYGDRGAGNVIPPGSTLVFEIELAEIQGVKPGAPE